jgi:hypothetical protein
MRRESPSAADAAARWQPVHAPLPAPAGPRRCRRLALLLIVLVAIELLLPWNAALPSRQPREPARAKGSALPATHREPHPVEQPRQPHPAEQAQRHDDDLVALALKAAARAAALHAPARATAPRAVVLTHAASDGTGLLSNYLGHAAAADVMPWLLVVALDVPAAQVAARHGALVYHAQPRAGATIPRGAAEAISRWAELLPSPAADSIPARPHASVPSGANRDTSILSGNDFILSGAHRDASILGLAYRHASILVRAGFSVWLADVRVVWRQSPLLWPVEPRLISEEGEPAWRQIPEGEHLRKRSASASTAAASPGAASAAPTIATAPNDCAAWFLSDAPYTDAPDIDAPDSPQARIPRSPAISPALSLFHPSPAVARWLAVTADAIAARATAGTAAEGSAPADSASRADGVSRGGSVNSADGVNKAHGVSWAGDLISASLSRCGDAIRNSASPPPSPVRNRRSGSPFGSTAATPPRAFISSPAVTSAAPAPASTNASSPAAAATQFPISSAIPAFAASAGSLRPCPNWCVLPINSFPDWIQYSHRRIAPHPVAISAIWLRRADIELRLNEEGLWAENTGRGHTQGDIGATAAAGGGGDAGGGPTDTALGPAHARNTAGGPARPTDRTRNTGGGPANSPNSAGGRAHDTDGTSDTVGEADYTAGGPAHDVDGRRYLAFHEGVLSNGLSNSFNALRSALAIAQITNRTLILPRYQSRHLHGETYSVDAG